MRLTALSLKQRVVIVGSGSGGLSTAARLAKSQKYNISIVDSAKTHYYQPLWTLVGGGQVQLDRTGKSMASMIPNSVDHVQENVTGFSPQTNTVQLASGKELSYDALVIACGLELNYDSIPGLVDGLNNDKRIGSNYSTKYVQKTDEAIKAFKGGNAIFTFPPMPIKCPGAPQKIMWIANDIWKNDSSVGKYTLEYNTALGVIFGVPKYANELMKLVESENVNFKKQSLLCGVDHVNSTASFKQSDGTVTQSKYDFLHVTPPQRPLELLRTDENNLTADGWVKVNKGSLQHDVYPNIFGLGDCSNLPTSKTAAAITSQHAIVATNIDRFFEGGELCNEYDGYTSCPLVTSQNTVMMAEFGYEGKVMESFFLDQGENRQSMYQVKRHIIPQLYWSLMMKGIWSGPGPFRKFLNPTNRQ